MPWPKKQAIAIYLSEKRKGKENSKTAKEALKWIHKDSMEEKK